MKEEKQLETQFKKPTEKRGIPVLKNRLKDKGRVKGVEASFAGQSYSEKFSSKEDEDFPVNYSLKYSETGDYNRNHTSDGDLEKENFEAYPDYAETDIDQPTDFSLKYGEETKESGYDSGQPELEDTTRAYYMEGTPNEGTPYNYSMPDLRIDHVNEETFPDDKEEVKKKTECTDITPLMFSRSSSVDSLSSFEEILQSIPDDRSSVVSDFSRVTSGIISPSELPDSPTQTVPPSPKQSEYFPGKLDDVPDCKKADPHPDCSRVSNVRSLNVETNPKEDNAMINTSKSEVRADYSKIRNPKRVIQKNQSLEQIVPDKNKLDAEKLELESVSEMEENILADCINIGLQEYSRRSPVKHVRGIDRKRWDLGITQIGAINCERPSEGRPNRRSTFQNESRKIYSTYEELDDVVHTYYTEGTPANVSHAGSHSDLSNLSIFTDGLILSVEDTSDDGSYCSGDTENLLAQCIQSGMPKAKHRKEKRKDSNVISSNRTDRTNTKLQNGSVGVVSSNIYPGHQNCGDYLAMGRRKDVHLTAKDEISTFATENSPCNFSIRSSLSDLTFNSVDSPGYISRPDRDQILHGFPSAQGNAISTLPGSNESEKDAQIPEENGICCASKKLENKSSYCWEDRRRPMQKKESDDEFYENEVVGLSRHESLSSLSVKSCDSSDLTPLEQALLEQCINSGMPHKTDSKEMNSYSDIQDEVDGYPGESLYSNYSGDNWSEDFT